MHINDLVAIGGTLKQEGHYTVAKGMFETTLEIVKESVKTDEMHIVEITGWLSSAYHDVRRWSEAEKLQVYALEMHRRILGIEHPVTIRAAANLACSYADQGRSSEAEKVEVEVLEQQIRILGMEHQGTIRAAVKLTFKYEELNRWQASDAFLTPAVKLSLKALGKNILKHNSIFVS